MKALVYTAPETLEFRDETDPAVHSDVDEALVRIDSVGICGSDMHAFLGHDSRRPAPIILGHEAAGVVVGGATVGQRVTVNPLVSCGACRFCLNDRKNLCLNRQILSMPPRPGAFAEYLKVPVSNLAAVPEHLSFEMAALAEPIACGWHAVRLAREQLWLPLSQASALVIGGGAIGVGAALSLTCQGSTSVILTEPNALRRGFLQQQGEIDARAPDELDARARFDLVIDCVGVPATRVEASRLVEPGGHIVNIGLGTPNDGLDVRRMTLQEIGFLGTYTYTPADFAQVVDALIDGRLGKLEWIETRPLAEGAQAFADIRAGRVAFPKIILKP